MFDKISDRLWSIFATILALVILYGLLWLTFWGFGYEEFITIRVGIGLSSGLVFLLMLRSILLRDYD